MKLITNISILKNFITARLFNLRYPIAVGWAITYKCNYRCKYCSRWNISTYEVSTEEARKIIDKLWRLGLRRINFTGGEPLIRKDIASLITYAKNKNIYVCLNSNGSLVPQYIHSLKSIDLLILSIEGPEHINDLIRQGGSFKDVIEAVKAAKTENIRVRFSSTLNKYNLEYVEELIQLANKFSISVTFQPVELYLLGTDITNSLLPTKDAYCQALKKIIRYKHNPKYRNNIGNSLNGLNYLLQWPNLKPLDCAFGKIIFRITPDGKMYPCSQNTSEKYSIDLTKVDEQGIKKNLKSYPNFRCSCGCSNRVEANLVWNLKLSSIYEVFKL